MPFATPRVAAGALFRDSAGRVLLVEPTYKPHWDIPGGYVEPGESPLAACIREVREELGLTPPIGPLLAVDWAPTPDEGDKLLFVFAGGPLTEADLAAIRLPPSELRSWAFGDLALVGPRLHRRIRSALAGRPYLEHGESAG